MNEEKAESLKLLKKNRIVFGAISVALGILLAGFPDLFLNFFGKTVGGVLLLIAIVSIVMFFRTASGAVVKWLLLVIGVIVGVIGAWIFFTPDFILSLAPRILGIILLLNGAGSLLSTFTLIGQKYARWWLPFLLALVTIGAGLILVLKAFEIAVLFLRIVGAFFIFDGMTDIWIVSRISTRLREEKQDREAVDAEGHYTDETISVPYGTNQTESAETDENKVN